MDRLAWLGLLCVVLIFFAGCSGGDTDQAITMTAPEGCVPPDDWSKFDPICSIAEQPPDVRYVNKHPEVHNLTIQVVRDNSTVVDSMSVTVDAASSNVSPDGTWRDVVDEPGNYSIVAIVDGTSRDSTDSRSFRSRYRGFGGVEWRIWIQENGEVNAHVVYDG